MKSLCKSLTDGNLENRENEVRKIKLSADVHSTFGKFIFGIHYQNVPNKVWKIESKEKLIKANLWYERFQGTRFFVTEILPKSV